MQVHVSVQEHLLDGRCKIPLSTANAGPPQILEFVFLTYRLDLKEIYECHKISVISLESSRTTGRSVLFNHRLDVSGLRIYNILMLAISLQLRTPWNCRQGNSSLMNGWGWTGYNISPSEKIFDYLFKEEII